MSSVEPSVRPCVERRCEDDGCCGKGLCGDAEDEDDGEGVHGLYVQFRAATPSAQVSTLVRMSSLS